MLRIWGPSIFLSALVLASAWLQHRGLSSLRAEMKSGFVGMNTGFEGMETGFAGMDNDFAEARTEMQSGFARIDLILDRMEYKLDHMHPE